MSFDPLAPHYRWLERVLAGRKLQRARTAFLDAVTDCQSVLIAGEGPGRFLCAAAPRMPGASFTVVDASAEMLRAAESHWVAVGRPANVEFIHAALPDWRPRPASFDLIMTPFFLDCFAPDELGVVVDCLARGAAPGAAWLVADFRTPERGLPRLRAKVLLALAYALFRPATGITARRVTPPDLFLERAGFRLDQRIFLDLGLIHSDLWRRN